MPDQPRGRKTPKGVAGETFDTAEYLRSAGLLSFQGEVVNPAEGLSNKDPYDVHADIWRLYNAMETRDGQIYAMSDVAVQAIRSLDYTWDFEEIKNKAQVEFWEDLDSGADAPFQQLLDVYDRAFGWGIAMGETDYEPFSLGWKPIKVEHIPPWWYSLDAEGLPHKRDPGNGLPDPDPIYPDKYAMFIYLADKEYPYGRGWLQICYPSYIKKQLITYNKLEGVQRFIDPKLLIQGKNNKDVDDTVDLLKNNLNKAVIGIYGNPDNTTVTPLQLDGKGMAEAYDKFNREENEEITKIIIGAIDLTESNVTGSRAKAETQKEVAFLPRTFARVRKYEAAVRGVVNTWNRLAFGEGAPVPGIEFQKDVPEDRMEKVKFIKELRELGFDMTDKWIAEELNIAMPEFAPMPGEEPIKEEPLTDEPKGDEDAKENGNDVSVR